jgi:hypothetical protein
VRIVENSEPQWASNQEWSVDTVPRLSLGALDGPIELSFSQVTGAYRLSDGGLGVVDAGSGQVRLFDSAGAFRHSTGGLGDGPGEFRAMQAAGPANDSIWIYDQRLNRLTMVDPETSGFRVAPVGARALTLGSAGMLADGSLLFAADVTFATTPAGPPPAGLSRSQAAYLRIAPTGETLDTVLAAPGAERFMVLGDGFIEVIRTPFARAASHALRGDRLLYGDQTSYEIHTYNLDGVLREITRRVGIDLDINEVAYREAVEARIAAAPEPARPRVRRTYDQMPIPTTRPAFGAFLVDAQDYLWVQDFSSDGTAATWAVFSAEGVWLGTVPLPTRFLPTQILQDEIVGVWRDELDVEYVRAYALTRD